VNVIIVSNKSKQAGERARLPSHLPFINVLICQLTQIGGTSLGDVIFLHAVLSEHPLKETELSYGTYE
jgi:hypothetical protein